MQEQKSKQLVFTVNQEECRIASGEMSARLAELISSFLEQALAQYVGNKRQEMAETETALEVLMVYLDKRSLPQMQEADEREFEDFTAIKAGVHVVVHYGQKFLYWAAAPTLGDAAALKVALAASPCVCINGSIYGRSRKITDWT